MLGPLLRQLRGSRSAAEVADHLGVVRSAVYLWESDSAARRLPSPTNLQALLDLYGASSEQRLRAWELRGARPPEPEPAEEELTVIDFPTPVP